MRLPSGLRRYSTKAAGVAPKIATSNSPAHAISWASVGSDGIGTMTALAAARYRAPGYIRCNRTCTESASAAGATRSFSPMTTTSLKPAFCAIRRSRETATRLSTGSGGSP